MDKTKRKIFLNNLHSEVSPALGCTEPAAVALACAFAAKELGNMPIDIRIFVSQYVFKNAMNVGIPGTNMIGLDIAVALGVISKAPDKELMVLENLSVEQKEIAKDIVKRKLVKIDLASTNESVYIEAVLSDGVDITRAIISGGHTNLILLEKNDKILFEQDIKDKLIDKTKNNDVNYTVTLEEIFEFTKEISNEEIAFLHEVINLNKAIAHEGINNDYGLNVGKSILNMDITGLISQDIGNYAVALTAAAADARMAGSDKPVMCIAGSGNQGITATVPIAMIGFKLDKAEEEILRSLVISILVTVHVKHYIGRLSVLCGCSIAAAIGTCCGIIYLLGGDLKNMAYGINNIVADISGVVCDGAKPGCALKIATAVNSAIRSASMAMNGIGANRYDGIVNIDVEKTLANLGTLGNDGMVATNQVILNMMLNK